MDIDLSTYTKSELLELHERVRDHIKRLSERETLERISVLKIGDIVFFQNNDLDVHAVVIRTNQKTLSVLTEEGCKWRLSPNFVKKVRKPSIKVLNLKKELFPFMDDKMIVAIPSIIS